MSLRHPGPGLGAVYRDPQLGFVGVGAAPADRWEHGLRARHPGIASAGPCPKPPAAPPPLPA